MASLFSLSRGVYAKTISQNLFARYTGFLCIQIDWFLFSTEFTKYLRIALAACRSYKERFVLDLVRPFLTGAEQRRTL